MNDGSDDRLAPVSYLPWAAPNGGHPAGRGGGASHRDGSVDADADADEAADDESNESSADAPSAARHSSGADAEHDGDERNDGTRSGRGRSERRGDSRSPRVVGRSFGRGPARLSVVGDDDPVDETGAERDARIDRLVVSRLRRSALSTAEVRAVLDEHGLDDGEIDEWIDRYERLGYLDDARLAEQLTHSHGTRRGRGSSAILHELERRGIEGETARAAVGGLDHDVELENATAVAERRARQLTGLDHATAERRLMAFLMRRGYPSSVVREAVTAALCADGS